MAQKGNLINFTTKEKVVNHNPISLLPSVNNVRRQNEQLRKGQRNFEGNVVENKMRISFPEPSVWNQLGISAPPAAAAAAAANAAAVNANAAAVNAAVAAANAAAVNAAVAAANAAAAPNLRGRPVLLRNANVAAANAANAANAAAAAANAAAYAAVNNRGRPVASAPPRPPNYNQQLARREEENLRRGINASLGRINPFNQYTNEEIQQMKQENNNPNNPFAGGKRRSRSKSKKSTKKKTTKKSRSKSKSRKH